MTSSGHLFTMQVMVYKHIGTKIALGCRTALKVAARKMGGRVMTIRIANRAPRARVALKNIHRADL